MTLLSALGRTPRLNSLLLLSLALSGCGSASASGSAKAEAGTDHDAAHKVESKSAWTMDEDEPADEARPASTAPAEKETAKAKGTEKKPAAPAAEAALLGARHDLTLGKGQQPSCKCLAAVVGGVSAPGFAWAGTRPSIDAASQLVVALSSEDIPCDVAVSGASYRGYVRDGENVVIQVEPAKPGRPVTHGAIIPKPGAGGKVFISSDKGVPYGQSVAGEARCALTPGK